MAVELNNRSSLKALAADLAFGRTQAILPCGKDETTTVWVGEGEPSAASFTEQQARQMLVEAIEETIDGLQQDDWTHLGETPEARIAKLEAARTWLVDHLA